MTDAARSVGLVAVFTALVVASDLVLSGPEFSNIKLLDTLVFVSAYLFGFRVGASVGILSETIWSFLSPVGSAGLVAPFLIAGEIIFALAGAGAARLWGGSSKRGVPNPLFVGGLLALCAFSWDFETNAATALIVMGPNLSLPVLLGFEFNPYTLLFTIAHEASDFAFGALLVPAFILLIPRVAGRRF